MKESILVVEDDRSLSQAVGQYLEKNGYEVHAVGGANEALAAAEKAAFSLAIVDFVLFEGNGLEVVRSLKTMYPSTAIIIWTLPLYQEQYREKLPSTFVDGYASKTNPPSELLLEVRRILRHRVLGARK